MNFEGFVRANLSCPRLVKSIIDNFTGFRDQAIYKGRQIFFYKRAQILVSDLCGAYDDYRVAVPHVSVPELCDQSELTMFADYRVPQILRHRGIFVYSEELAAAVDSEKEMAYSSEFEVELRAATVDTVGQIFKKVQAIGTEKLK